MTCGRRRWRSSRSESRSIGARAVSSVVFSGAFGNAADGAVVTITGPATSRTQTNDGSGFYGFVDLPPGPYTVRAALPGLTPVTNTVSVVSGVVTNVNLIVSTNDITPPAISGVHALNISDTSVTIAWSTDENADSRVDYGLTTSYGATVTNGLFTRDHSVALTALAPGTLYHYRVTSIDPLGNEAVSGDFTFTTNPSGVVNDIIIDNPAASVNGAWGTGNSAGDRFGADYRFKSQGAGAAYLQYTPTIVTAGTYQVYEWHSVGGNRTTNAPFSIRFDGGSQTVFVNEKVSGGSWNLLGTFRFAVGTGGYIRITDGFADAGQVVIADAVKFVYVPPLLGPSITAQPQSQSVKATSNATFTVSAAGTTPLSFQWLFESTRIPNATANSYTRLSVRTNDAGSYFVLIANAAGSVTSSPAVLSVIPLQPPLIVEQPRSQFAVTGGSASFSVVASSASPLQYQWFFNGAQLSNRTELPLSLPDVQAADFGTYHVQLRNEDGTVLSNPAVLGLASAPEITALLTNGTHFNVAFDTEPGPTYSLEYNRVLTGEPWQTLTNIAGNGSTASFDDILSSEPTRLYRVRIR
ncbi:MAG TPA: immunoglobulin domain-containing protein [Verrucomicrobiae bacterium]